MAFQPVLFLLNLLPNFGAIPFEPGSAVQLIFNTFKIVAYFIPFDTLMPVIMFIVSVEVFQLVLVIFRFLKSVVPIFGRLFGGG
jgi:hypothetical protein